MLFRSLHPCLKYAPIYNIDKDVAGAYVIARRGLGFEERLPKNYRAQRQRDAPLTRDLGM